MSDQFQDISDWFIDKKKFQMCFCVFFELHQIKRLQCMKCSARSTVRTAAPSCGLSRHWSLESLHHLSAGVRRGPAETGLDKNKYGAQRSMAHLVTEETYADLHFSGFYCKLLCTESGDHSSLFQDIFEEVTQDCWSIFYILQWLLSSKTPVNPLFLPLSVYLLN